MASPLDTFNTLPKTQQAGIIGGALLLVAGLVGYFLYSDLQYLGNDRELPSFLRMQGSASSLWAQIDKVENDISAAEAVIARRPKLELELESLESEIEAARKLLPQNKDKEILRDELQRYAREVSPEFGDVQFNSVQITEDGGELGRGRGRNRQTQSQFGTMVYHCRLQANMEGLIAYIDKVETSTFRFMAVQKISISPGELEVDEEALELVRGLHEIDLDIVTYVYEEGAQ